MSIVVTPEADLGRQQSRMDLLMTIRNDWRLFTFAIKSFILDAAGFVDAPLHSFLYLTNVP